MDSYRTPTSIVGFSAPALLIALTAQLALGGLLFVLLPDAPTSPPVSPLVTRTVWVSPALLEPELAVSPSPGVDAAMADASSPAPAETPPAAAEIPAATVQDVGSASSPRVTPAASSAIRPTQVAAIPSATTGSASSPGSSSPSTSSASSPSTSSASSPSTSSASATGVLRSAGEGGGEDRELRAVPMPSATGASGGGPGAASGGVVVTRPAEATPTPAPVPRVQEVAQARGEDRPPRPIRHVPAQYPAMARNQRITGTVVIRVTVADDGRLEDTKVLESPSPLLDRAALDAVSKMKFEPALINGKATRGNVDIPFRFVFK